MPINPDAVGAETKPSESRWTSKDCLLYALGVGAGQLDAIGFELEFTTENSQDVAQRVLPTFAVVASVNSGGGSLSAIGTFDHAMLVHGEQAIELHRPLPVEGHISTVGRIAAIYDKGAAAVVVTESDRDRGRHGRAAVHQPVVPLHPGRGRLGRRPGPVGRAEPPHGRPRPPGHLPDPSRPGAALPALGRPEPAARRPEVRGPGRVRQAHPARPVHLRLHRPGPAPHPVRLRSRSLRVDVRTLLQAGHPGRHPDGLDLGAGRRQGHLPHHHAGRRRRPRRRADLLQGLITYRI